MSYLETIKAHLSEPEQLELLYRRAVADGQEEAFRAAVSAVYQEQPEEILVAAWHYRFVYTVAEKAAGWAVAWGWAILVAVLNGLVLWLISDTERLGPRLVDHTGKPDTFPYIPLIILVWAPISAVAVMLYLMLAGERRSWPRLVGVTGALAVVSAYALLLFEQSGPLVFQQQYLTLVTFHLPLMAWAGVGVYLLFRRRDAENRFAFLIKSLEVFIMAGLAVSAGGVFVGITFGLFDALGIELPKLVMRLLVAGGGGLIPVLATAIIYNPRAAPVEHAFDQGLSKLFAILMRLLLPLSLLVLGIYILFIPFNFREPFLNRDVLIIYNAMLFAVMALLLGATPVSTSDLSSGQQKWLRRGIIALAVLALLVSLYALAAIVYRTWIDRPTPNRLAFIGWNVVNTGILALLLYRQWRTEGTSWLRGVHKTFATGAMLYVLWAAVVILLTPWLFGLDRAAVATLPESVQRIVHYSAPPILLRCTASPHIYALEDGHKRWIKDIPTFEGYGYRWNQVRVIACSELRAIPDGPPIPPDAGPPPQP
ncbi:MAG: hypothetical protein D6775_10200 [Caldilineae bacterium]|nr:MAG: hypothetical protein D6775_10200 [Caldilineae bacterium]